MAYENVSRSRITRLCDGNFSSVRTSRFSVRILHSKRNSLSLIACRKCVEINRGRSNYQRDRGTLLHCFLRHLKKCLRLFESRRVHLPIRNDNGLHLQILTYGKLRFSNLKAGKGTTDHLLVNEPFPSNFSEADCLLAEPRSRAKLATGQASRFSPPTLARSPCCF